jgi:uncharacterized membrane protein
MSNLKPITLGILAGMRSMLAPAFTSLYLGRKMDSKPSDKFVELIASPEANLLIPALALGELAADKLPFIPDRIWAPALFGRMVSGAISGQAIEPAEDRDRLSGALAGALVAAGSAFTFFYLRKELARRTHIPTPVLGLLEDLLAIGIGITLLNSNGGQD